MPLLDRLRSAGRALFGSPDSEERSFGYMAQAIEGLQQAHRFKPHESLQAYGDNPYLHSAINVVCSELARTDFVLEEKKGKEWVPVEEHQALATLRKPMPKGGKSSLTQMQLFFMLGQKYLLNGEDFWLLDGRLKLSGAPTIVRPLQPGDVDVVPGKDGVDHFLHKTARGQTKLRAEDVVHFRFPSPSDLYRGHSPASSIRYALDTHLEADILNLARLKNNAVPAGILTSQTKVGENERKSYLDSFKRMFGGSSNASKLAFLPFGVDYKQVQQTNEEMQYAQGKERNRDEILANFRIGLELLGRTEAQTRANADASIYVFQKFVILPLLEMVIDTLSNDYLTQFPGTERMRFTFPDPVPEDVMENRETARMLFSNGAMTPDEMRQQFGLDPLNQSGVSDTAYMPINMVPIGSDPFP